MNHGRGVLPGPWRYANRTPIFGGANARSIGLAVQKNNPFKALMKGRGGPERRPRAPEDCDRNRTKVAENTNHGSAVADRYATALFELAENDKQLAGIEGDLGRFAGLLDESADLRRLVKSPVFSAKDQARAVGAVLDRAGIGGLVGNLVKVAAGNRRLFVVPDIIAAFRRLLARHRGEVSAEVTSAAPLDDGQLADLKAALKASLGKDVALATEVDPALIGGLIVKVGSRMIDGSVRTKLNSLKLVMKEVG
jgi:F-type H+-transporting ATPase subunit delta